MSSPISSLSASSEHLLFGKILIERTLVTPGQLEQCLRLQAAEIDVGRPRRSLGDLMIELGFITKAQLDLTLAEQRRRLKDLVIGPYHIIDKLGSGGMGAVYRAQVPDTGVEVALKLLPKKWSNDPNFLSRFHREAKLGMELNHPHLVRTIDFGESKGTYYIAMEVVEGGTLDHHLHVSGAIPERTALKIARDLLGALQYAHEKGLIHRDIKPSNILFDREGKSKLSDFGLVKAVDPDPQFMTQGTTVGTPHYMAPEQARGEPLDIRADLYAMGATLYHALTGQTPFSGSSAAVMHSHLKRELPPPETLNPNLSPGCVAIIKCLMAKDRKDRYPTPAAAAEDILRLLRGEQPQAVGMVTAVTHTPAMQRRSASATPPSSQPLETSDGTARVSRRPPLWMIILLVSGVVWLAGLGLMIWFIQDLRRHPEPIQPSTEPRQERSPTGSL
jgi:eukaryotic-like serine/threonine-protein kinase